MIYFVKHDEKVFIAWLIEDMIRNTRNFIYKSSEDFYDPHVIKLQIDSLKVFDDSENFNPE